MVPQGAAGHGQAVTVVSRRRVRPDAVARFEATLREFLEHTERCPGHRGIAVLRPLPGGTEYTVISHFADVASRRAFTASPQYHAFLARLAESSEGTPAITESQGVEIWLEASAGSGSTRPPRWKTALATLLGVYPTSLALGATLGPSVQTWPRPLASLALAVAMVALLTWLVMPFVTRALHSWLFSHDPSS